MRPLLCALLPVLLALPALAEEPTTPGSPARFFEVFDKDRDGKVTPEELEADREIFGLLDKNGDGLITPEDLSARPVRPRAKDAPGPSGEDQAPQGQPGRGGRGAEGGERRRQRVERLRRLDKDGDGRVSKEEYTGPMPFEQIDRNGDGFLDEKDIRQGGRSRPGSTTPGQGQPGKGKRGQGGRAQEMQKRLKAMDKDGDGRIAKAEYTGPMPFERLDQNGDGFLDAKDRALAGPGRGRGQGQGRRGDPMQRFRRMDKNQDGVLDASEMPREGMLERLDIDGDGKVSTKEFEEVVRRFQSRGQGQGGRRGRGPSRQPFRRFDQDGDGKVTREEFPGEPARFDELDANKDGVLSEADRPEPKPSKADDGKAGLKRILGRDDVDGDKRVSRREFRGKAERFDALDQNQDGFLDAQDKATTDTKPAPPPAPEPEADSDAPMMDE